MRGERRAYEEQLTRGLTAGTVDLVWVPAEGGAATVIIAPVNGFRGPHFTSSSDRIWVSGRETDSCPCAGMGRTGKVTSRFARSGPGRWARSISLRNLDGSRQGDQALAQVGNNLYVVTVPRVGRRRAHGVRGQP